MKNLKRIKAEEVTLGDLVYTSEGKYFRIIETSRGLNSVNINDDTDYADTDSSDIPIEQYVKDWLYVWNGEVEFYRETEVLYPYALSELIKMAETKDFKAECKTCFGDSLDVKFKEGDMFFKEIKEDNWKEAHVSIWWDRHKYRVYEDSLEPFESDYDL